MRIAVTITASLLAALRQVDRAALRPRFELIKSRGALVDPALDLNRPSALLAQDDEASYALQ